MPNAKRHEIKLIRRETKTLTAAGTTSMNVSADDMPSGLIHKFRIRIYSSALTGFTAAVANYQQVLNSVTYGITKPAHVVMGAVPGLLLDRLMTALNAKASERTTPTANGFAIEFDLPFSWDHAKFIAAERPKDTACWNVGNKARPYINLILGSYADVATGTITTPDVVVEVYAHYEPNPVAAEFNPANPALSGDLPGRKLEFLYNQKSDLSAAPTIRLNTGGERLCYLVALRERNSSTLAEVTDIFNHGASTPSKFDVKYGASLNYTPDMKVEALDRLMSDKLGAAINSSLHIWTPMLEGRVTDAVDVESGEAFTIEPDNVTASTRLLDVLQVGSIKIPATEKAQYQPA